MYQRYYKLVNKGKSRKLEDIFKDNMISRNQFIDCYKNKKIIINDEVVGRNYKVKKGDDIKLLVENEDNNYEPIESKIQVIYEDEDILAVDKPVGVTMNSSKEISLSNYLTYIYKERGLKSKIRYFNRLDRDTSGIVIIFKNKYIQGVFENEKIKSKIIKEYTGIVSGHIKIKGIINKSILREGIKSEVNEKGKKSITEYIPLEIGSEKTLVKFMLYTGRTHQIRVHMASIGHPLFADTLYGKKETDYESYFLQCSRYRIYSRKKESFVDIKCKLPSCFFKAL